MRGLIGNRLLKLFAGHDWHSLEHKDLPEAASNHADVETADSSDNGGIDTPSEHPDSIVHGTKAEAEVAKQHERA